MSLENLKVGDFIKLADGARWFDTTPGKAYRVDSIDEISREFTFVDDVGDEREPYLETEDFVLAASFSPNDTVRLKSGEPFTTGSYTAEVDSVRSDIVLLKHGSWLAVDAVEKVEAWLPDGDGWTEYSGCGTNPVPGAKVEWLLDWERRKRVFTHATCQSDLLAWSEAIVAYRVVEPAPVPAAEPAAETKPKFKVGDRVRVVADGEEWDSTVVGFEDDSLIVNKADGWADRRYGNGHYWCVAEEDIGLLTELPEGTYAGHAIGLEKGADNKLTLTMELDTAPFRTGLASLQADLADQFQRIADALRAA